MNQVVELTEWRNRLLNELLLRVPSDGKWDEALARINSRLGEGPQGQTWQGAQVTLDLGARAVPHPALLELAERLKQAQGMMIVAVVATDPVTREAARLMGWNTYLMLPGGSLEAKEEGVTGLSNALYLSQTIRSGQRVVHNGHVVIGGDVNPGAEVIAEGDILIFGTLRGVAHAGSQGNEAACITAGNMRPQLVRIAGQIARAPEDGERATPGQRVPEVARIENGVIQVSPV